MEHIKVLIADDHALMARMLEHAISRDPRISVVKTAYNGSEVMKCHLLNDIDVILLDIMMPVINGPDTLDWIKLNYPEIKIIMLSACAKPWMIKKMLSLGASGYVTKFSDYNDIINAIVAVYEGHSYMCRHSMDAIRNSFIDKKTGKYSDIFDKELTLREKEVLKLILEEFSSNEIADKLFISKRTVETHRKNIMQKMGVKNLVGLIKAALQSEFSEDRDEENIYLNA
ncbi:MAG: response regulator [Bacteroidota bacterium]